MNKDYTWFDNYTWQYLDILNCRFINMDREKRLKEYHLRLDEVKRNLNVIILKKRRVFYETIRKKL
jgi:hypothetical protein